jgi:serine protease Do
MAVSAPELDAARLGDSNRMAIGDFVLAVGSPFGLSHSVTYGIVSAKGRHDLELGADEVRFQDFIQTDAAINPGNSGGPLINLRGEVIGINTAIASASGGNEGIGFAIPINMAKVVARQLIDRGKVARAFLGVKLDSNFDSERAAAVGLPNLRGTRISGIEPGSPAEQAQLQVDDIILSFGDVNITDDNHLVNVVGLTEVGKEVPVVIFRKRAALTVKVKVGKRNQPDSGR